MKRHNFDFFLLLSHNEFKESKYQRLASKTNSVTLNNTFLNDIEILKQQQNKKFDSFTDSEKGVILR